MVKDHVAGGRGHPGGVEKGVPEDKNQEEEGEELPGEKVKRKFRNAIPFQDQDGQKTNQGDQVEIKERGRFREAGFPGPFAG